MDPRGCRLAGYDPKEPDGRGLNKISLESSEWMAPAGSDLSSGMPRSEYWRPEPTTEQHTLARRHESRFWQSDPRKQADSVRNGDEFRGFQCHGFCNRN